MRGKWWEIPTIPIFPGERSWSWLRACSCYSSIYIYKSSYFFHDTEWWGIWRGYEVQESTPNQLWSTYHYFQKYFLRYKTAKKVVEGVRVNRLETGRLIHVVPTHSAHHITLCGWNGTKKGLSWAWNTWLKLIMTKRNRSFKVGLMCT